MAYPVFYFHSDMRGAPVLNGVRGTGIALLDACLNTGFGQVTANSVTVAGGIATASLQPGQGFSLHANIQVAGATPAALNGVSRVTEATETSIKFPTSAPDGAATGTITIKVAGAGWTKPFRAANKAVFRSADVQGSRHYFRFDETATNTLMRVRGYEKMTTVDAGTGLYPTNAQINGGGYWSKSVQADATPVAWEVIADSRFVLFRAAAGLPLGAGYDGGAIRGFGDPVALNPAGDAFASCVCASFVSDPNLLYGGLEVGGQQANGGVFAARGRVGTGGAVLHDTKPYTGSPDAASGNDSALGVHPSPVDGKLRMSPRFMYESDGVPRADVPGVFHVPQSGLLTSPIAPRDYIDGAGALAGRTLVALPVCSHAYSGRDGWAFVDITGPWR